MQTDFELETIVKDFEAWRKTREHKKSKIPVELISAIKRLGNHYKRSKIAHILNISGGTVNKILGIKKNKVDFVEVPCQQIKEDFDKFHLGSTISCILQKTDGTKLILEIEKQQITHLIQAFLCCK